MSEHIHYETPQTNDGVISQITFNAPDGFEAEVTFSLSERFLQRINGNQSYLIFCLRSRVARLGINVRQTSRLKMNGNTATIHVSGQCTIPSFGVAVSLRDCLTLGVPLGRLVYCDPEKRMGSHEILQAISRNELRLPNPMSLCNDGRLVFQPHRTLCQLKNPITHAELLSVLARDDGREVLNRIQEIHSCDNVIVDPGQAIITTCTMFLHRHFVALDSEPNLLGQHFQAITLDPVETRSAKVFLEIANTGENPILNPSVSGYIYRADQCETTHYKQYKDVTPRSVSKLYHDLNYRFFGGSEDHRKNYGYRPLILADSELNLLQRSQEESRAGDAGIGSLCSINELVAQRGSLKLQKKLAAETAAYLSEHQDKLHTLALKYFPNAAEHSAILQRCASGEIRRIIFQHASFEHGPFFSEKDHARLMEYDQFDVELIWLNAIFKHVAVYMTKMRRGYFVPLNNVARFKDSLFLAVYGSTRPLNETESQRFKQLIAKLKGLFGDSLALVTGGGSGVMEEAAQAACEQHLFAGANFLENVDHILDAGTSFYQTFQGEARHMRQRWFEICRFHLFCIGGVGTLEEIGLTLTDIKLGLLDQEPLIFFGSETNSFYWKSLIEQLELIADTERGPSWLKSHVLATDDPEEVLAFYRKQLSMV